MVGGVGMVLPHKCVFKYISVCVISVQYLTYIPARYVLATIVSLAIFHLFIPIVTLFKGML